MRIDRRLTIIGVMLVVLSMTMATQYVNTEVGFTYAIVHPSNADIRFVGFDNSTDEMRVIRTFSGNNNSGELNLTLRFGNVSEMQNLTYSAAFGIVNEERFQVNITNCYVNAGGYANYLVIYLHRNPTVKASDDDNVLIWDKGYGMGYTNASNVWQLAAGNGNPDNLNGTQTETGWDTQAYVRFTNDTSAWATTGTHDYVWVQISIVVPDGGVIKDVFGSIVFCFQAHTLT